MGLSAFHGKQKIKDFYIKRVHGHFLADEIVKGKYWEGGHGCGVGCTIHSGNHESYETELGIPQWLARVEDRVFEGLPNERAKKWPLEFLEAIKPGVDLDKIKIPFLIFVVESALEKFDHKKNPKQAKAIKGVLEELKKDVLDIPKLRDARDAATAAAAAYAANTADAYAATAATYAATAAAAATDATYAYAAAATDATAAAAAYAATADAYAAAAAAAARQNEYVKFADKILELIKGCK